MSRKFKRWVLGLAVLALLGFAALNMLAYRHAYAMMHFTADKVRTGEPEALTCFQKIKILFNGVNLPRPKNGLKPSVLGANCRAFLIDGDNGVKLGAWYCPGPASGPLVILFHGYGGEKCGQLPEAKAFLEMGCSAMLVDFRGSGDSSESYTTIGYREADDVAAAVRYAREHLTHSRIILFGHSMGAAAILRAVHDCGVEPDAIIVEAVFDRMLNAVRNRFHAMGVPSFPSAQLLVFWGGYQAGFNAFKHNPVEYAASVRCPILFLHGSADPRAHVEEARRVFDAVPGPKEFKEFPGLGHHAAVIGFPAEWKEAVGGFLKANRLAAKPLMPFPVWVKGSPSPRPSPPG